MKAGTNAMGILWLSAFELRSEIDKRRKILKKPNQSAGKMRLFTTVSRDETRLIFEIKLGADVGGCKAEGQIRV